MPSAFDIAEQQLTQASSTSAQQNAFDIAEKNLAAPDLPEVVATQPEGDGFLAKINAALKTPSPEWLRAPEEATRENVMAMLPHDPLSYLKSVLGPAATAYDLGHSLAQGDVSGIPLVGRVPEIMQADETPAFSKERYGTAERVLMDLGMLAGAGAERPSPLRTEPIAMPDLPPSPSLGPGTIAGDVSRALERRFTMQPEPPPDITPSVPIEQTLPQIPREPPVFNPELGPQTIPETPMPLRTEPPVRIGEPLKPIPFLDGKGGTPAADAAAAARVEQPSRAQPAPVAPTTAAPEVTAPQPAEAVASAAAPEPYTQEAAAARTAQPEAPPEGVPQKPSKIGQSIEAKAVEAKLTEGFTETAGYDPITIKDQAERATSFVKSSPSDARAVIRGDASLPQGLRGTSLITAMEEHLLRHPDAQVAYELANSPLTSATSAAAQEMRLMAERVPDSIAAKFQEIREARKAGSKLRGETAEQVAKDINKEVIKQASKRPTWEAFVREITC